MKYNDLIKVNENFQFSVNLQFDINNINKIKEYISIDELLKVENSPLKILNLDKNLINDYLDDMKRNELININRTAGGYKWRYYDDYTKELCNIPSA